MCDAGACGWIHRTTWVGKVCLVAVVATIAIGVFSQPAWPGAVGCVLVAAAGLLAAALPYVRGLRPHPTVSDGHLDNHMLRMFTGGLLPMALCAIIAEAILTSIGSIAILGLRPRDAEVLAQAEQAREEGRPFTPPNGTSPEVLDVLEGSLTPRVALFFLFLAFCVAACLEETLKWAMLRVSLCCGCEQHSCCLQPRPRSSRATIALMIAISSGFSTIENLLYVGASSGGWESKLVTTAGRILMSLPLHLVAASFTAVRLASYEVQAAENAAIIAAATPGGTPAEPGFEDRAAGPDDGPPRQRSCRVPCALVPAVLIHGSFDLVLLAGPALFADRVAGTLPVGAAIAGIICALIVLLASVVALRYEVQGLLGREDALADSAAGGGDGRPGGEAGAAPAELELPSVRGPQARTRPGGASAAPAGEGGVFASDDAPLLAAGAAAGGPPKSDEAVDPDGISAAV